VLQNARNTADVAVYSHFHFLTIFALPGYFAISFVYIGL